MIPEEVAGMQKDMMDAGLDESVALRLAFIFFNAQKKAIKDERKRIARQIDNTVL